MSESGTPASASWKFWYPLSFWKVLLIFTLTNLAAIIPVVALRELLSLNIPTAAAGGAGGFLGVVVVSTLARKAREAQARSPAND